MPGLTQGVRAQEGYCETGLYHLKASGYHAKGASETQDPNCHSKWIRFRVRKVTFGRKSLNW